MERHLDTELNQLNVALLRMATMTENAIHNSMEALQKGDKGLAARVIDQDEQIDEMEIKIEEQIIDILARFQPLAGDLRFITTGMHINSELERIADLTVNISQRVFDIADQPHIKPLIALLVDIPKLTDQAKIMVRNAIDSFVKKDEELAKNVILSDQQSNQLRTGVMQELIYEHMVKDGSTAPKAVSLILVARDLERICDLAASIAEDVIYMVQAKVVRHHRELLDDTSDLM